MGDIHGLPGNDPKGNETNIIHLSKERRALRSQTGRSGFQDHLVLETEPDFRIILRLENARPTVPRCLDMGEKSSSLS